MSEIDDAVEQINKDHALVLVGDKALVLKEIIDSHGFPGIRFLSIKTLSDWYANRRIYIGARTDDGCRNWAELWMKSSRRRQYSSVRFDPTGRVTPDEYNLWRGYAYEPAPPAVDLMDHVRHFPTLYDHVLINVANGDPAIARWIWGWAAQMFQAPEDRIGVSLVFRGRQGAGKSVVGEVFGRLLGRHYVLVDSPDHLTGHFNAHMASCLLLQADEAVWAGDKVAEGKLKSLITASQQLIEKKNIDPERMDNYVRIMMTSNCDWVVPAGLEERRFCVLDVGEHCLQNRDYFGSIWKELNSGGFEHLLAFLLAYPWREADLNKIPQTKALADQKISSLDTVLAFWFERLRDGSPCPNAADWPDWVSTDALYGAYSAFCDRLGRGSKKTKEQMVRALKPVMPGGRDLVRSRRWRSVPNQDGFMANRQIWGYALPGLSACRDRFADLGRLKLDWDEGIDDVDAPPSVRQDDGGVDDYPHH